jgi:hypothetical protein
MSPRDQLCTSLLALPALAVDLRSPASLALEELVEPSDSLQEGRLLCELDRLLGDVSADSKAVLDIGVQRDLVWNLRVLEDVLRLPSLLSWEDLIGFWRLKSAIIRPPFRDHSV